MKTSIALTLAIAVCSVGCPMDPMNPVDPMGMPMPEILVDPVSPIGEPLTLITGAVKGVVDTDEFLVHIYFHFVDRNGSTYSEQFQHLHRQKVESVPIVVEDDGRWMAEFNDHQFSRDLVVEVIAVLVHEDDGLPYVLRDNLFGDGTIEAYLLNRSGVEAVFVQPRPAAR